MLFKLFDFFKKIYLFFLPVYIDTSHGGIVKLNEIISVNPLSENKNTDYPYPIKIRLKNGNTIDLEFIDEQSRYDYCSYIKKQLNYKPYFTLDEDEENETEDDILNIKNNQPLPAYFISEGIPSDTKGRIGDYYTDKNTDTKYGPKTELGWGEGYSVPAQEDTETYPIVNDSFVRYKLSNELQNLNTLINDPDLPKDTLTLENTDTIKPSWYNRILKRILT